MTPEEYNKSIVTISKEHLATLPPAEYKGKICVVDDSAKLEPAILDLNKSNVIGFDTETRPSFRKGMHYNVALIQLATNDTTYLFRTNKIGYPKELIDILQNPEKLKIGLSIHDDFLNLRKVVDFEPQGFVDLQPFVKEFKIADNSLSRLYGILFGERISKGQRLSNWEAEGLTEAQCIYAALDAYSCLKIYNYLNDNNFNPKTSPYLILPPEPEPEDREGENKTS